MHKHYIMDLKTSVLEIMEYPVDLIREDLKLTGLKRPMDLDLTNDFNTKIFRNERDAENWRTKYVRKKSELLKNARAVKGLPKLLCKQRYILLSALGEKTFTRRTYNKKWPSGTKFQLYDQKIFLTVELTKITEEQDGKFTYIYKVV